MATPSATPLLLLAILFAAGCGADSADESADGSSTVDVAADSDATSSDIDARPSDDAESDSLNDADADAADASNAEVSDDADTSVDVGPPGPTEPVAQIDAPPESGALSSLPNVGPFFSDAEDIVDGFMRRRLTIVLAGDATVAQINALLVARSAAIATARPGDPIVTLEVPPMADRAAAVGLAEELVATGLVEMALPAFAYEPVLAEEFGGGKRLDGAGQTSWLEDTRIYGA